ncbi:hypothetical protein TSUD_137750 [Trifolium subterraneum]|uniref:Uncharacterized protein n=1 Tax=Trifolium subterraneum TaxID=3900 RepID=A0A2Z6PEJ8_TRISU|nr:hypothetical protein TSUD_137750 [Trifolium subterraneum]
MTRSKYSRHNPTVSTISDDPKPIKIPIIGFGDHELVDDTPNEKLPLLVMATIVNHEVSRKLVDQGDKERAPTTTSWRTVSSF